MSTLDSFFTFIQRLTHVKIQFNEYFHLIPNFPRACKNLTTFSTFFWFGIGHWPATYAKSAVLRDLRRNCWPLMAHQFTNWLCQWRQAAFQKIYKMEYLQCFFDFLHIVGHQLQHDHGCSYFRGQNDLKNLHRPDLLKRFCDCREGSRSLDLSFHVSSYV